MHDHFQDGKPSVGVVEKAMSIGLFCGVGGAGGLEFWPQFRRFLPKNS